MKVAARRTVGSAALLMALALAGPGHGARPAVMRTIRPALGTAYTYTMTQAKGDKQETYVEHVEELEVGPVKAYQRIQEYPDRVVRATVRQSDLSPLFTEHLWKDGSQRLLIKYEPGRARVTFFEKGAPAFEKTLELLSGALDNDAYVLNFFGYPFDEGGAIPIDVVVYYEKKAEVVALKVAGQGRRQVTTPAGDFDCSVLELSLAGIFGGLAPSSDFLVSRSDPPFLVKVEWGGGEVTDLIKPPRPCSEDLCREKAALPR